MKAGDAFRSKNRMFWRSDLIVAAAMKDQAFLRFMRACGQHRLFFDDIDPAEDNGKDVTKPPRRGYQAITWRAEPSGKEIPIAHSVFVARGTGPTPIAACLDAYAKSLEAGDPVPAGLDSIITEAAAPAAPPPPAAADDDFSDLIG